METTKKYRLSDRLRTQRNSSSPDELRRITYTAEEEQDDLPYYADIGTTCKYSDNAHHLNACTKGISGVIHLSCPKDNKKIKATANNETLLQPEETSGHHRADRGTVGISAEMPGSEALFREELPINGFSKPDSKEHLTCSKMSSVLLRHFPKGELISTCQLIECETIPETSFTESIDDTTNQSEPLEHVKGPLAYKQWTTNLEEYHLGKHKEIDTGDKNCNLLDENRLFSKMPISSDTYGYRQQNSQMINESEDMHIFEDMKGESALLKKTLSPQEFRYSHCQAHHCLPDLSEVASQVQVPERRDHVNSVPTTEGTKSFPILLSKSGIANNILENKSYFRSIEVENQEVSMTQLEQQLEVQTQHTDTQSHTDHLRLNPKILPQSDFPNASIAIYSGDIGTSSRVFTSCAPIPIQSTNGFSKARLQRGTTASALPAAGTTEACCLNPCTFLPELTQGEKLSQVLKDQTDQLIKKAEDFCKHETQETFLTQDKYLALNQLKRHLAALEKNYLTAREEHRNLQLQNYKGKSTDIGEFDPERKVEGEIFRLGMLLEDIQEKTDDSKCTSSLLASCESAHSSYSLCESSVASSIADPPERRATETAFLHKNEAQKSQTTDVISQTNQLSLESNKCNLCLHMLQARAASTSRRETEPLGEGDLLGNKQASNKMTFLLPEEKHAVEGLASHCQGTLSQKFSADEGMKGNTNIQERRSGTCSLLIQRKPTDLSDTNLSSDSDDISAYESCNDSQSEELGNYETESYKTFNTRLYGERKGPGCKCPKGSKDQFKLRNYKESVQSCPLCRNKSSGSAFYSWKRISNQKAQKNKQLAELVNRLSERQNFEAAKSCYPSTYDKISLSHQCLPSNRPARNKSAINSRNTSDSNASILSSTLDHAIQTANSLKKATERMVRAVSEDLAKVKRNQL